MFFVYLVHNTINNKVYVGKTNNIVSRWLKHKRVASGKRKKEKFYFQYAIAKYGVDNFTFSILQNFSNEKDMNEAEIYWISFYQSNDGRFGYNLTLGGEGVSGRIISEETREKMREAGLKRHHSSDTIVRMSGEQNHGAKLTEQDVIDIRRLYKTKQYSLVDLAKQFNSSPKNIKHIIIYDTWINVIPEEKYEYVRFTAPSTRKIRSEINKKHLQDSEFYNKTINNFKKLDEEKVKKIRYMYEHENVSEEYLANLFGVLKITIKSILNRQTWKNI